MSLECTEPQRHRGTENPITVYFFLLCASVPLWFIEFHDSIFQFAGITSLGSGGASIEVYDSQIHSQTIEALGDGTVTIHNSAVHGAAVISHESTSAVHFDGGAFLANATGTCEMNLDTMVDEWGVPNCNPWLAPGAEVTRAGSGPAICAGTYDCGW